MRETITYIYRKPEPNYKSIEGIFYTISEKVGLERETSKLELQRSGGNLGTLWSNMSNFQRKINHIYHITGDVQYMGIVTRRKSVLTVHDVKSIVKGRFLKRTYMKLFWFWLPALFVKRITVISEFTKKELEHVIPFAKRKIRVVPNPVNDVFQFKTSVFNKNKPRILLLGTKSNKNLERTFKALEGINCEVMLIGKLTKHQDLLSKKLNLNLTSKFDLSLEQVVVAYQNCDILCFASTYEGFGMPIIEAQATGRPVLTSNLGAMKEVAGDSALLVNPFEITSIRAGINQLINDQTLRESLIKKGSINVQRFCTETVVNDYLKIYTELETSKVKML